MQTATLQLHNQRTATHLDQFSKESVLVCEGGVLLGRWLNHITKGSPMSARRKLAAQAAKKDGQNQQATREQLRPLQ